MKIIEMMLQLALRVTEMLIRFSLQILLALFTGAGKIIGGFLSGFMSARARQPDKHRWQQSKPRRKRRKQWR